MKILCGTTCGGSNGSYTIKIEIETSIGIESDPPEGLRFAGYDAEKLLTKAIGRELVKANPKSAIASKSEREGILGCFEVPIYVKEIPNGYCSDYCCEHLPWFLVTTKVGVIKIGWRKRVISIDWSESDNKKTADELFKEEDTTKDGRTIHAWGYEKAKEYIAKILA